MKSLIEHDLVYNTLATALRPGDIFTDLFAEWTTIAICRAAGGELRDAKVHNRQGVGIRRAKDSYHRHVHTPDISVAGLQTLAHALGTDTLPKEMSFSPVPMHEDDLLLADMICIAREAEIESHRSGGASIQVQVTVRVLHQDVLIGRSDGRICQETRNYTNLRIEVVVRDGRKVRKGDRQIGAITVDALRQENRHLNLARNVVESANLRLEAVKAPTGDLTVILGPGGPATLLHEACGHILEADLAQHPLSAYHDRLNTRVASPIVTLIDDPGALGQSPLYHLDDEGEPANPTTLIEQGVLRDYLYDRCSALVENKSSNGHGRRISYIYPPLPRMSATYVAPGESPPEEIIAETDYGLFVHSITSGDTDMGSGRFNLRVNEGYLVENGRITTPIIGAVLSGRGPEVLQNIDRVGNNLELLSFCYSCNKLDQYPLVVTVGQPTLRIRQLSVWGG